MTARLISFSGGRSSAYMLHSLLPLQAGDVVAFANTGKEREETLRFVQRCADAWRAPVVWLEYRADGFAVVDFDRASRNGEPFDALIERKKFLPNSAARFCTQELKVKLLHAYMRSLGHETFTEAIGLRADEPWRLAKMIGRNADEGRTCTAPLAKAGVTKRDVLAFWNAQRFDLELGPGEGNCDLCFLKGAGLLRALIKDRPESADWWIGHERARGASFTKRDDYETLHRDALANGFLPFSDDIAEECGLECAGDDMPDPMP